MRSSGSIVGMGLDPDGVSSSLNLMNTVGVFAFSEEPSEGTTSDPDMVWSTLHVVNDFLSFSI